MTDIDKIRANALIYGTGNAKVIVVALSSFDALCEEVVKLRAVATAAKAEVLAQGYRSSDMAKALRAADGEFWFETSQPQEADGAHGCPTPCDGECEAACHESHQVPWKRNHEPPHD